jgi:hypothetical protein
MDKVQYPWLNILRKVVHELAHPNVKINTAMLLVGSCGSDELDPALRLQSSLRDSEHHQH